MKTLKTKLFELASINNGSKMDEIEREVEIDVRHRVSYKERIMAVNKRNIIVCEMVSHQKRNNGDFPFRGSPQEKTVHKLNRKYLRDNPYWNKTEQENWKILLDKWEEKESQIKQKDMNDFKTLIDEKEKANCALYRHRRLGNLEKVKSIQNHIEYLKEKMQKVSLQSVITKKSGKYYTKRYYNTGF